MHAESNFHYVLNITFFFHYLFNTVDNQLHREKTLCRISFHSVLHSPSCRKIAHSPNTYSHSLQSIRERP